MGYYRRFVPNLSRLQVHIRAILSKACFEWDESCTEVMKQIKQKFSENVILAYPVLSKIFYLDTDASDLGLGAVLSQEDSNGFERPVAFASRTLHANEKVFTTMEKECLVVVWAITKVFHPYLYGSEFLLRTDNQPLTWLKTLKDPPMRIARWIMKLQEYNFKIEHRSGRKHQNADALSRLPLNAIEFISSDPVAKLRDEQLGDPNLGPIMVALESGSELPADDVLTHEARMYKKQFDMFFIRSGILMRRVKSGNQEFEQTLVPDCRRPEILKALHDDPTAGHLKRNKMIEKMRERYHWNGVQSAVEKYCKE